MVKKNKKANFISLFFLVIGFLFFGYTLFVGYNLFVGNEVALFNSVRTFVSSSSIQPSGYGEPISYLEYENSVIETSYYMKSNIKSWRSRDTSEIWMRFDKEENGFQKVYFKSYSTAGLIKSRSVFIVLMDTQKNKISEVIRVKSCIEDRCMDLTGIMNEFQSIMPENLFFNSNDYDIIYLYHTEIEKIGNSPCFESIRKSDGFRSTFCSHPEYNINVYNYHEGIETTTEILEIKYLPKEVFII